MNSVRTAPECSELFLRTSSYWTIFLLAILKGSNWPDQYFLELIWVMAIDYNVLIDLLADFFRPFITNLFSVVPWSLLHSWVSEQSQLGVGDADRDPCQLRKWKFFGKKWKCLKCKNYLISYRIVKIFTEMLLNIREETHKKAFF